MLTILTHQGGFRAIFPIFKFQFQKFQRARVKPVCTKFLPRALENNAGRLTDLEWLCLVGQSRQESYPALDLATLGTHF